VQLVSVGFTLAGLGVVAAGYHRVAARPALLGLFAILAVLTLLPAYHRYYDAAMLIVPFIWAVAALRRVLAKQGQAVIPRRAND